jgi:hypothetical protein
MLLIAHFHNVIYFNFLGFKFVPLHVLCLGLVPYLLHPCYSSDFTFGNKNFFHALKQHSLSTDSAVSISESCSL